MKSKTFNIVRFMPTRKVYKVVDLCNGKCSLVPWSIRLQRARLNEMPILRNFAPDTVGSILWEHAGIAVEEGADA